MTEQNFQEIIKDQSILDELKDSYLNYAMSVIISRALPDVRDGLKPSQRRILVAMNDLNLGPRSKHRKCAKIAGDTSGNYHPHGEGVVYPTLVRMGQLWNMRQTLIDPQGNFGSTDGDPPAAMRYTEARMTAAAADMLVDINRDTVDFVPNYDETTTEPVVLPSRFPSLLVNGSMGIAVGMATSIPPHNPTEVCNALIKLIDDPDCGFKEIMQIIPGPDFPTGGMICGRSGIIDGYTTGRGTLAVRAKMHTETTKKGKTIIAVTHDINLATQYCDEILLLGADSSYHIGKTKAVLSPEKIKEIFNVDVFAGKVGQENFFIPLGKYAKDGKQINNNPGNTCL